MGTTMAEITVSKTLLDEVKEFTDEKWRASECEVCGVESWEIAPDLYAYAYVPVGGEAAPQNFPAPSRPILWLSCRNCGNVRFIDREIFERWRAEQKAKKSSN
jgi:hypothetical protein